MEKREKGIVYSVRLLGKGYCEMDYVGQIFGTRKIVREHCYPSDWEQIGQPMPRDISRYRLGECLCCGAQAPVLISGLRRNAPRRCRMCSGINHYKLGERNTWVYNDKVAICNVPFHKQIISFTIDYDNYQLAHNYVWRISQKRNKYYVVTGSAKKGTMVYLHQLVFGGCVPQGLEIDHIDGNSLNNCVANLRLVSHQENCDNIKATRIDCISGVRGVSYDNKAHLYRVDFQYHGKRLYPHAWKTIEEATYCRMLLEQFYGISMCEHNPIVKAMDFNNVNTQNIAQYVKYLEKDGK